MGCCGRRERYGTLRTEQKWDYINLDDFKSTSCLTPLAYGYLLVMFLVSISVYVVDIFTAANLLFFDRWSGQIKPIVSLKISRWIFFGCIMLSIVLLVYRWIRAIRVMRQGGVAKSYLDPLAVRVQSIRMGKNGRGWKRFLVFAELTKSRKGADYVALFTYYSFEAWLRIVFAEGPRQVINAMTLYSVLQLQLLPTGSHSATGGHSAVVQFFVNIGILADSNRLQAVILFGMLWTLFIWVISMLSLIISVIFYFLFLWHHIPTEDGTLKKYCRKKINRRMERIVKVKVDKALKKENEIRAREEARAARSGVSIKKQPTLPNLEGTGLDPVPGLSRQTTMTTLPEYTSRPATGRASDDTLPTMGTVSDMHSSTRYVPKRTATQASDASWSSYNSTVPLIRHATDLASPDAGNVPTTASANPSAWNSRPNVMRNGTGQYSQRSHSPGPSRPGTAHSGRNQPGVYPLEPIPRPPTATGNQRRHSPPYQVSPIDDSRYGEEHDARFSPVSATSVHKLPYPIGPSDRPRDQHDFRPSGTVMPRQISSRSDELGRRSPFDHQFGRGQTPGPSVPESMFPTARGPTNRNITNMMQPERSFTPIGPPPNRLMTPIEGPDRSFSPFLQPPLRSMTPQWQPNNHFTSSGYPPVRDTNSDGSSLHSRAPSDTHGLPRLQTELAYQKQTYIPYSAEPRSMTPVSARKPVLEPSIHSSDRALPHPLHPSYSRNQSLQKPDPESNRQPPSRQHSGVDEFLNNYY